MGVTNTWSDYIEIKKKKIAAALARYALECAITGEQQDEFMRVQIVMRITELMEAKLLEYARL